VQPAPVSQLVPLTPPAFDRLVATCLAKDPADRVQSAHDVKLQLQWAAEGGSQSGAPAVAAGAAATRGRRSPWLAVPLLVGVLGLAAMAYTVSQHRSKPSGLLSVQVPVPPNLTLSAFWSAQALSPDGASIVARGSSDGDENSLWALDLRTAALRRLPGTEQVFFPAWSPDSRSVVYYQQNIDGLFRMPAAGGPPTRICSAAWGRGVSWGRRDVIVFAPNATGPLQSVAAGGGAVTTVTELDASRRETAHRFPCFLPDGEHFLFAALPKGPDGFSIYVGSLSSKAVKPVMTADCAPIYAEPGYVVFVQDGKVMAQRFDLKRLKPVGEKLAIAEAPPASDFTAEPVATASKDQRLLYPSINLPLGRLEWLDRSGVPAGAIALPEGHWSLGALSHDGHLASAANGRDLWQIDLDRAIPARLSPDMVWPLATAWSPDSRRLAFDAASQGRTGIVMMNAGGSGTADTLRALDAVFQEVADWAPDGKSLLVAAISRAGGGASDSSWDLWTVPVSGGGKPTPWLATDAFERNATFSPDGRWILFEVFERGLNDLYLDSWPTPGRRVPLASGTRGHSMWSRGGNEVLYADAQSELVSVPLEFTDGGVRPGRPTRLFRIPEGVTGIATNDGERFLVSSAIAAPAGTSLQLILDWTKLLPR
jgi:Tol biopolymer transport system component